MQNNICLRSLFMQDVKEGYENCTVTGRREAQGTSGSTAEEIEQIKVNWTALLAILTKERQNPEERYRDAPPTRSQSTVPCSARLNLDIRRALVGLYSFLILAGLLANLALIITFLRNKVHYIESEGEDSGTNPVLITICGIPPLPAGSDDHPKHFRCGAGVVRPVALQPHHAPHRGRPRAGLLVCSASWTVLCVTNAVTRPLGPGLDFLCKLGGTCQVPRAVQHCAECRPPAGNRRLLLLLLGAAGGGGPLPHHSPACRASAPPSPGPHTEHTHPETKQTSMGLYRSCAALLDFSNF